MEWEVNKDVDERLHCFLKWETLVCLITCITHKWLRNKAVVAANNSLITCCLPHAFTPFQLYFCHSGIHRFLAFALIPPHSFLTLRPNTRPLPFSACNASSFGWDSSCLPPFTEHVPLPFLPSPPPSWNDSLRAQGENVAALCLPSSEITLTFHTCWGHSHLIRHARRSKAVYAGQRRTDAAATEQK